MTCDTRREGAVQTITLRHGSLNTLTPSDLRTMGAAFDEAAANQEVRVVIIESGVENVYSYGIEPEALLKADIDGRLEVFRDLGGLVRSALGAGLPILTAINGPAFAGGAVLALLADYAVIDAAQGRICFSEAKVGLPLPIFVQDLIKSKCRSADFFEIAVLARNVDAAAALETGLCRASFSSTDLKNSLLRAMCDKIIRLPRAVLKETLLSSRASLLERLGAFLSDPGQFRQYMSDDYIGRGLRALTKS